ncbi:MFS transporter [Glutamicibacter endophyticus]|uniref:MFS transporter n=1 Tax=Glutamicibacter endophyticus TaxID=1522174 RepID=UPI003AEF6D18
MNTIKLNSARSWVVFVAAVLTYLSAVAQRTSFGVAGIEATERFTASAQVLAAFSVVQLIVYAGAQVPVGLALDRFGPRLLITCGAAIMALGQGMLAVAESVGLGLTGRIFVGAGDAMVFVSVLRLLPMWFSSNRIPLLTQLTGTFGQLGQLVSLIPFHALLVALGWTPAFSIMSGLALATFLTTIAFVRNGQDFGHKGSTERLRAWQGLALAWRQPGTKLGFWTHFTTAFMCNVFMLSWGYPFLVEGQGLDDALASSVMSVFVVVAIVFGPILGALTARYPQRRSNFALTVVFLMILSWSVVLLWPGQAPLWLLIVLMVAVAAGGPASVIAFDFARTFNPPHLMGTATGVVNTGGFFGGFLTIYLIGLIMDWLHLNDAPGTSLYNLDAFRVALSLQLVIAVIGVVFMVRNRRKAREQVAREARVQGAAR